MSSTIFTKSAAPCWVQAGAGTTFPIVQKVYPREKYEFIAESGEWYKIKLSTGEESPNAVEGPVPSVVEGWINSIYAKKEVTVEEVVLEPPPVIEEAGEKRGSEPAVEEEMPAEVEKLFTAVNIPVIELTDEENLILHVEITW